ncbi:hypothetical protein, partial [Glaciibacter superstes]|uniref:hypothetical protein n=1 Tax=Glaciibacter superstes TaxID=501023 RepID=UPI0005268FED
LISHEWGRRLDRRLATAGAWEMSMWSTRSAASMNDIDIEERRLMVGRRGDGLAVITGEYRW